MDDRYLRELLVGTEVGAVLVDADDTLWHDRRYFRQFYQTVLAFARDENARIQLSKAVLSSPGLGELGFIKAIESWVSVNRLSTEELARFEDALAVFRNHPVDVLPFARECLELLARSVPVNLYSKGLLNEQHRKLSLSGLAPYFQRLFIVEEKSERSLREIASGIAEDRNLTVIGNSIVQDIEPAVSLGMGAIWLNHADNLYGRDGRLPAGVPEVCGWSVLTAALET